MVLRQRILSAVVLIAALIAAVKWLSTDAISLLIAGVAVLGVIELVAIFRSADYPCPRVLCVAATIAYMLMSPVVVRIAGADSLAEANSLLLLALTGAVLIYGLFGDHDEPLQTIALTLLVLLYLPFLLNFMTRTLFLEGDGQDGRALVLYAIVVVKVTDSCAYLFGSWIGRRRMAPQISPGKTWEGSAAGVAGGLLIGWLLCRWTGGDLGVVRLSGIHVILLPACLSIMGIVGDLIESMFKRSAGVKDSGRVIRGMGGMLDVIDSLLLALPVQYVYVSLFLT